MGKINKVAAIVAVLGLSLASTAARADIIQASGDGGTDQILFHDEIGQSFTAVDALIASVGFGIRDFNPISGAPDLTLTLYEGAGFGGTILGTETIAFADILSAFNGAWNDFVFGSSVSLTVNNVYTARLETATPRWGLRYSDLNPYAGGAYYTLGSPSSASDAKFRVLAAADVDPVPAPGAALLAMIGFGMVNRVKRRFA